MSIVDNSYLDELQDKAARVPILEADNERLRTVLRTISALGDARCDEAGSIAFKALSEQETK